MLSFRDKLSRDKSSWDESVIECKILQHFGDVSSLHLLIGNRRHYLYTFFYDTAFGYRYSNILEGNVL
jgi:hypothetical protein